MLVFKMAFKWLLGTSFRYENVKIEKENKGWEITKNNLC